MGRFIPVVAALQSFRNAQVDLLTARAQLAAGLPRHRVTSQLLAQSQTWDSVAVEQLRWQISVARQLGSSLQPVLQQLIEQEKLARATSMSVQRALQVPRLTNKLVAFTPWLGLLVAQSLGLAPLRFLLFSPPGWAVLVICALLQVGASYFAKRTLSSYVKPVFEDPGAALEAAALAVESGIGFRRACRTIEVESGQNVLGAFDHRLASGLGLSHILKAQADLNRQDQTQQLNLRLEQLGVKLLLPMAAFLLPQFMLLTVVPIAASSVFF
jgi:tight adherence protein B